MSNDLALNFDPSPKSQPAKVSVRSRLAKSKVLLILLIVVLANAVAIFSLDFNKYAPLIVNRLTEIADENDLGLSISGPDFGPLGLSADQVDLFIRQAFLLLEFKGAELSYSPLRLLTLRPDAALQATLYKGRIAAELRHSLFGNEGIFLLNGSGINFAQQPQFSALGFRSAELSFDVTEGIYSPQALQRAVFKFSLEKLDKPESSSFALNSLPGMRHQAPFTITVPAFREASLTIDGKYEQEDLRVNSFRFASSLGEISGEGSFAFREARPTLALKLNARLTAYGKKELGAYLPLLSYGKVKSSVDSFEVELTGPVSRPTAKWNIAPALQAS